MKASSYLMFTALLLISCDATPPTSPDDAPEVIGLWLVESVNVGEEIMTPTARWVRFNKDSTQQSGNGWKQHSIGTWSLNTMTDQLTILNSNGWKDESAPFTVAFDSKTMQWKRHEEGMDVTVSLHRISELPTAPWDQLLGVWSLQNVSRNDSDLTAQINPSEQAYLFLRNDQRFNLRETKGQDNSGAFQCHPHRQQITFYTEGSGCGSRRWNYEVSPAALVLTDELGEEWTYARIDYFPETAD